MGVDIQTYRAKIGTYKHSHGVNVITQVVVVNFSHGLKTVGSVLFIGILLIMAGVEQNPGPRESDFFVFSVSMAFAFTIFGVILRVTGFANLQLKDMCFVAILIVAILIMNYLYYHTKNKNDDASANEVNKAKSVQPVQQSNAETLPNDNTTSDREMGTADTRHQRTQRTYTPTSQHRLDANNKKVNKATSEQSAKRSDAETLPCDNRACGREMATADTGQQRTQMTNTSTSHQQLYANNEKVNKVTPVQSAQRSDAETLPFANTTCDREMGSSDAGHQSTQRTNILTSQQQLDAHNEIVNKATLEQPAQLSDAETLPCASTTSDREIGAADAGHQRTQKTNAATSQQQLVANNEKVSKATSLEPAHRSDAETLPYDNTTGDREISRADAGHPYTQRTYASTSQQLDANNEKATALCNNTTSDRGIGTADKGHQRTQIHKTDTPTPQQHLDANNEIVNKARSVQSAKRSDSDAATYANTTSEREIGTLDTGHQLSQRTHIPTSQQQLDASNEKVNKATSVPPAKRSDVVTSHYDITTSDLVMSTADTGHQRKQMTYTSTSQQLDANNEKVNQPSTILPEHRSANETLPSGNKTSNGQADTTDTGDTGHLHTKESYTRMPQQQEIANNEKAEALPCVDKTRHGQTSAAHTDDTCCVRTQATTARMSQQQDNANNETVNKNNNSPIAIVEKLGLSSYIDGRITIKDMITIDPYKKAAIADMKQLPWILLKRILSVNNEAMDLRFEDQKHLNTKRTRTKRSVHALFDSTNERGDISPLDVFLLAFQCCDPMLKQLLYKKLFLCKMAVPFIYREPFTLQSMLSIWPLRFLLIESKNKKGENEEAEILNMPTKIVTFARFGRPRFSKSKLLNRILSETVADVFFNKDCPFGTTKRIVTNGFVEMFWLPLIGNTRYRFNDTVTFLNMRGDIGNSFQEKECEFTAALTDVVVMVCDLSSLVNKSKDLQKSLVRFSSVILIIASPIDQKDHSVQKQLIEFESQFARENKTEMQIMCTHECMHEKSATEILTDITEVISDYLKATPNMSRPLEERLQSNRKCMPNLDENKAYIHAKETAFSVVQMIEKEASQDQCFFDITPAQSSSSCQLSDLLKQQQTERDFNKHEPIKQKIKHLRLNQTEKSSSSVKKLIEYIMKFTDSPCLLQYFLNWLKYYLEYKKRRVLPGLIKENQSAWDVYWKMKKDCDISPRELEKQKQTIKQLEGQIDEASFGIENLLREIYHICDAVLFLNMNRVITLDNVNNLADAVACMVCNGHVLELLDGNSFYMPTEWIKLVLKKIQDIIGPKKVLTLSVLGLQSSGKSTMLNTMFGIQFSASSGRCTRGIHMQMLPLKQPENMQQRPFDYVIVIDTEGLRAPELSYKGYKRDNELATIITGLGDITILNVMGENMSELREILQILIHAFLRLKLANERLDVQNSCYFVHQNVTDITASEKMKTGLQISIKHLDSVTEESALSEGISHITTFNQVIEFDTETHVWHLPNLWQDNPPIARVNRKYSEAVVDICQKLILKALNKTTKSYKSLHDIYIHTEDLWKGVLAEDFVFSFRNSLEKRAWVDLETKFKKEIWCSEKNIDNMFHELSRKRFSECDDKDGLTKASSQVTEKVKHIVATAEASITEKMTLYFSNNSYKDTTIQWKQHMMNQIKIFCKEIKDKKAHELDIFFNKRAVDILTNSMHTVHEEQLRKETIQLANELKGKSMTQTEINNRFEEIWGTFVSESLKSDDLKESEGTLENNFNAVLTEMYTNLKILIDILQKQPLRDRNPEIRKLAGAFGYTNISEKDISIKSVFKIITGKIAKRSFKIAQQRLEMTFKDLDLKINQLCIENKEITPSDIKSFLKNVCETVENISESEDEFTLKVTFKIKTVVFVSRFALSCFDKHNEEFNKVHGLEVRLVKYKQQVKERFDAHFAGCKVEETAARLFRLTLEDFLYEAVKEKLPLKVKHYLKGQFPTTKYYLITGILDDLMNKNKFKKWIHYIKKPKDFADSWIIKKSECLLFATNLGKYYELATEEINDYLKEVISSITRCGQHLNISPLTIHTWIEHFRSNLETYTIPKEFFRDVVRELEPVGDIHIDHFTSVLLENVQNSGKHIALKFRMIDRKTIKWTTFNPYKELCTDIWGCPEQCIFCGEPCTRCSIHTGSTHSCIQHRPSGCKGTHNKETHKISLTSCNFKIASDITGSCSIFNYLCNQPKREPCSIEKHPYRQYRQFLKDWDIEPTNVMECRSKLWMWFMATYKEQLEELYDLDVSNIPESWGDIEKEDAREDLRNIYK